MATSDAQRLVDNLAERRTRLVWKSGELRRVLDPSLPLKDQILVLVASCNSGVNADRLFEWTEYGNRVYFERVLRRLHSDRLIEYHRESRDVELLPPGFDYVASLLGESL